MGRELRKVPKNWQHPRDRDGEYIPLLKAEFYHVNLKDWKEEKEQWDKGFEDDYNGGWVPKGKEYDGVTYEELFGDMPDKKDYMPEWKEDELTHIQLYETTSEGTPESPVFEKSELDKLCAYAAEHCFTFADYRATKEEWKQMLISGYVYHEENDIIFM